MVTLEKERPKVPDITCPQIDAFAPSWRHQSGRRKYTDFQHKQVVKTLEQLRDKNDAQEKAEHTGMVLPRTIKV